MMSARYRLPLLGLLAVAVALLAWFAPDGEVGAPIRRPDVEAGKAAGPAGGAAAAAARPGEAGKVAARSLPGEVPDLFRAFSWHVPPPPPSAAVRPAAPPPQPAPPPLPFAYLGEYAEGGTRLLILSRGNRVLTVGPGEIIADTYRLDGQTGGEISFTYLPLDIKQTLDTGPANR